MKTLKDYNKIKKNYTKKKYVKLTIKNNTPLFDKKISKYIKKNLILDNNKLYNGDLISKYMDINSFKPSINKDLITIMSKPNIIELCNNSMLEFKLNNKCYNYKNINIQNFLLDNLNKNKLIDCNNIIPPKQFLSNCWFNTLFTTFFISDKGRKFFKFFRKLMITGKLSNGKNISPELRKAFFIFNIAIESSYNEGLNKLAYLFNTNLIISKIYNSINKKYHYDRIYNINKSGNPLEYYLTIIKYLNDKNLNIARFFDNYPNKLLINNYLLYNKLPDMIILEMISSFHNIEKIINFDNIKYSLDSAIIRDNNKQHFCSLLTCNNIEFSYDGASFSRISKFNWKNLINKNLNWGFEGHNLKWNFKKGYKLLFYYRIN